MTDDLDCASDGPETDAPSAVPPPHCDMSGPSSPLRTHLALLARGNATLASARAFRAAAATLLGREGRTPWLEDALQAWALSLVARPASLRTLLSLEEPQLRAAIRRSLRRALTDLQPDWPLRKALAEHVRALLSEPWPGPLPGGFPARLTTRDGHRLQRLLVAQALSAWPSGEPLPSAPAARVRVLVRWLTAQYFSAELPLEAGAAAPHTSTSEDEVRRRRDGLRLAHQVLDALGPRGAEWVERRAHGESLQDISHALRLPVATVHDRVEKALRTLAALLDDEPALRTWGAGMQALRLLRELRDEEPSP